MTESPDEGGRREPPEPAEAPQPPEELEPAGADVESGADQVQQQSGRRTRWSSGVRAGIPTLALLVLLAIASFVPGIGFAAGGATEAAGRDLEAAIGGLQTGAPVLVDIDGDLGTYPEIRYATRAALADLMLRGANVAVVSFSGEGRAIAVAEIARLRGLGVGPDRVLDLGFRSGGEPALVQLASEGIGPDASGSFADAVRKDGLASFRLALVIGGAEIGPRSWVEQIQPRVPKLPIAAITPSFLLPEVLPYRGSGQLVALVGTLPAGLAYGQQVAARGADFGPGRFAERSPSGAAIVFGMLVAIAVLLASSGGSLAGWARAAWKRGRL